MADNENVTIRINVKADTAAIDKVQARLAALCAQADSCGDTFSKLGRALDNDEKSMKRNTKETDKLKQRKKDLSKIGKELSGVLGKTLRFAMKATAFETAAYAAALSSVNLLLKSGALLARAWNATVRGVGVAAANAAAGVAALAAVFTQAMRQFAAAQGSGSYKGSFVAASSALRTLQTDTQLAVFGLKSLTSAFAAASKNAPVTGATVKNLRGLADFAVATGDMEKGLSAAANLVSMLQSGKAAGSQEVLKSVTELGPAFEKVYKDALKGGKTTSDQMLKLFSSGALAKEAGVAGTAQNVRGTLMGQLKAFGTEAQTTFADLGAYFIGPVQKAFERIRQIFYRTVVEISGNLGKFGQGPFVNTIVKVVDKLAEMTTTLFNEYLPKTQEVVDNFVNKWHSFTGAIDKGFKKFRNFLNQFSDASKEINKFFGTLLKAIGGEVKGNFGNFADLIMKNRDEFQKFGKELGELISQMFRLTREIREGFFSALPAINKVVGAITTLVGAIARMIDMLGNLGPIGGLLGTGIAGAGMMAMSEKGRKKLGFVGRNAGMFGTLGLAGLATQIPYAGGPLGAGILGAYAGKGMLPGMNSLYNNKLLAKSPVGTLMAGIGSSPNVSAGSTAGAGAIFGAGMALNDMGASYVENKFGNTGATVGASALGGATTGALAGATMFSWTGPGAAIAAGVGALIGGTIGAISGWMKSGAAKKKARAAGEDFANGYSEQISTAMQYGAVDQAQAMIDNFKSTLDKATKGMNRGSEARKKAQEVFDKNMEEAQPAIDQFNRNMADLQKVTGKSKEEIIAVAQAAEVDLSSGMLNLQEVLQETGLAVGRFGEDFDVAMNQAMGSAIDAIDTAFSVLDAPRVMDEAAKALQGKAGALTDEDRQAFLRTLYSQAQLLSNGDPLKAAEYIRRNIGTAATPGIQFTTPGARLEGMGAEFYAGGGANMVGAGYGVLESSMRDIITQNIISEVARIGGAINIESLTTGLAGMGFDELTNLAGQVRTGGFLTTSVNGGYAGRGGRIDTSAMANDQLSQILGFSADLTRSNNEEFLSRYGTDADKISNSITGFGTILEPLPAALNKFNENIDLLIEKLKGGDTTSPRRNLVHTMASHNRFDMGISGKRSISSGYRTFGLGSPSSDHAAGRAIDVVGQNLGLYKSAVLTSGGYADFHGAGGSRHLHVVPGDGPIGDTTTPYMGRSTSTGTVVNSNDSYSITVNASPGMDVKQLADEVINRLNRIQKNSAERTS